MPEMDEPSRILKPALQDPELMRELLLTLEESQLSPRQPIVLSLIDLGEYLDRSSSDVETGLDFLLTLELIDGSGRFGDEGWIFRKLTVKGVQILDRIRESGDWEQIKRAYATRPEISES